jgi:hypothetical protein
MIRRILAIFSFTFFMILVGCVGMPLDKTPYKLPEGESGAEHLFYATQHEYGKSIQIDWELRFTRDLSQESTVSVQGSLRSMDGGR